jgi:hypothetical protein
MTHWELGMCLNVAAARFKLQAGRTKKRVSSNAFDFETVQSGLRH